MRLGVAADREMSERIGVNPIEGRDSSQEGAALAVHGANGRGAIGNRRQPERRPG